VRLFALQTGALAAVALAVLGAIDSRALAEIPADLEGTRIARVEVAGNRLVETDALLAQVRSRAGGALSGETVAADLRALWTMKLFDDVRVDLEPEGSGIALHFQVVERPRVRKVLVSGNRELSLGDLQPAISLRRGGPVDRPALAATRRAVRELYQDRGYVTASVDVSLSAVGAGEVDVAIAVDEGSAVRVRRVDFTGNRRIDDAELRRVVAFGSPGLLERLTGSGPAPSRATVEREVARLLAYYRDRGYLAASVGPARVELSRDRRGAYIWIPVHEGSVHRIARVERGSLPSSLRLPVAPGQVASAGAIRAAVELVRGFHLERGHAWATVEPDVRDEGRHRVALGFRVEPGPHVFVERIRIRGAASTRDKVIRRELAIAEGELYRASAVEESRRRLAALGYFDQVALSTARGSGDGWIALDVEVRERRADTVAVSFGYSSSDAVVGQARLTFRNLLGRGQSLELAGMLSRRQRQLRLRWFEPHLLDTDWAFAFDVYDQTRLVGDGRRAATGGSITLGRPLSRNLRWFATYKLEQVGFAPRLDPSLQLPGELEVGELFRGGLTSSVTGTLQYDTRDDPLFPTTGSFHTAAIEMADPALGSENAFTRLQGSARRYIDVPGPFVLSLRGEAGLITSRDPRGVPLSERYRAGGLFDVRGFDEGSLGPRIPVSRAGDPGAPLGHLRLGGNLHLLAGAELEFPISRPLGLSGVLFADAGNTFNLEDRYCRGASASAKSDPCTDLPGSISSGIRSSVGFGLRWMSPIGPLRFEWGIPLDRQPGEPAIQFQFAIGGSF